MSSCKKAAPKCVNSDNISVAIDAINSAMRRKGLGLGDMYDAVNRLVENAVTETILHMREARCTIRKIARKVHMDDKRVSAIIKSSQAKDCKKCKPCKKA